MQFAHILTFLWSTLPDLVSDNYVNLLLRNTIYVIIGLNFHMNIWIENDQFTSVATFQHINMEVAKNLPSFRTFPAMIGECGGKNYHFVHNSADVRHVAVGTIRSAFEYGGQKCSACSRWVFKIVELFYALFSHPIYLDCETSDDLWPSEHIFQPQNGTPSNLNFYQSTLN